MDLESKKEVKNLSLTHIIFLLKGKGERVCSMDLFFGYILGICVKDVEENFMYVRPKNLQAESVEKIIGIEKKRLLRFLDDLYAEGWLERDDSRDKVVVKKGLDILEILGRKRILELVKTRRKGIICVDYAVKSGLCGKGLRKDVVKTLGLSNRTTKDIMDILEKSK